MVYGLNMEKMNCQRIFNLFCLYGNIVKVRFSLDIFLRHLRSNKTLKYLPYGELFIENASLLRRTKQRAIVCYRYDFWNRRKALQWFKCRTRMDVSRWFTCWVDVRSSARKLSSGEPPFLSTSTRMNYPPDLILGYHRNIEHRNSFDLIWKYTASKTLVISSSSSSETIVELFSLSHTNTCRRLCIHVDTYMYIHYFF